MLRRLIAPRLRSVAAARGRGACSAAPEYASSCTLPTTFVDLPLVSRAEHSHNSTIYEFATADGRPLNLPVCACVLLEAPGGNVRPYTPISEDAGRFSLLVKRYERGAASSWLDSLPLGARVPFKHISANVKEQYPFEGRGSLSMVCGGTGITPMYQALKKVLGTPGDERRVTLLYGNTSERDILLRDELESLARAHPARLKLVHVLGDRPDAPPPPGWADTDAYVAESGWVDKAKIARHCAPPADDAAVFVCGARVELWCRVLLVLRETASGTGRARAQHGAAA